MADDLWKSINNILGYGDPREERASAWRQLETATQNQETPLIEGIQPASLDPLPPPTDSPYQRDSDEITSIYQKRGDAGFRDVIINPQTLGLTDFACVLNAAQLAEIVQYDPTMESSVTYALSQTLWRSVTIPFQGNFVKVEVMHPRMNYADAAATVAGGGDGDPNTNQYLKDQTIRDGFDLSGVPFDGSDIGMPDGRNVNAPIIIQFDSEKTTTHIARHGDTFNCPFNNIIVTVKTAGCRVRITVGFNATIRPSSNQAIVNSQLHFAGAPGLVENFIRHPVPFCINNVSSRSDSQGVVLATNASINFIILDQTPTAVGGAGNNNIGNGGVGVGWLTGVNMFSNGLTATGVIPFSIYVLAAGNEKIQRLYQGALLGIPGGSGVLDVRFTVPIRFVLHNNWKLVLRSDAYGGANINLGINVSGYSIGAPRAQAYIAGNFANVPPYYLPTLTENPYPGDHNGAAGSHEQP